MTEKHLDDFRVFARLEQHARIGVPQGVKVELIRRQSVLMHKALEYRLRTGVCPQFAFVVGKHQIVRADKRFACRALLHPTGFLPFEQSGFQYVGHRHFAHARRRLGVRNYGAVVYDFAFRVAYGNSVTAESIEMMPLSKSTFFHFSASASPMRNPANICIIHSAFMKSFFEMTSRKYSRISIGIALYVSCLRSLCSGVDLTIHSDTGLSLMNRFAFA